MRYVLSVIIAAALGVIGRVISAHFDIHVEFIAGWIAAAICVRRHPDMFL